GAHLDARGRANDDARWPPQGDPVLILALLQLAASPGPTPARAATVVEYLLPRPRAFPHDPAVGRDGIVWYTDQANSYIGRLDPTTGQAKLFPVATPGARPYGLVAGPNGTIWMALFGTNKIGRITAADGALREYPLPDPAARPRRLAVDAHGIVWYSDYARGQ